MKTRAARPEDFTWLRTQCGGLDLTDAAQGIVAVDGADRIYGVVAFDQWTLNSAHLHMAGQPIAARVLIPAAFEYLFEQLGRGVAYGCIRAGNARSLRLARRVGFVEVQRLRDGWAAGEDLVMLELRKENCRWLSGKRKVA